MCMCVCVCMCLSVCMGAHVLGCVLLGVWRPWKFFMSISVLWVLWGEERAAAAVLGAGSSDWDPGLDVCVFLSVCLSVCRWERVWNWTGCRIGIELVVFAIV